MDTTRDRAPEFWLTVNRLAETMAATHEALIAFDGARFMRNLEQERAMVEMLCILPVEPAALKQDKKSRVEALLRLCRVRKALLASTCRTVAALAGVCAASSGQYQSWKERE